MVRSEEFIAPNIRSLYFYQENHFTCWAAAGLTLYRSRYGTRGRGASLADFLAPDPYYSQLSCSPPGLPEARMDDFFVRFIGARSTSLAPLGTLSVGDRRAMAAFIRDHAPIVINVRQPRWTHYMMIVGYSSGSEMQILVWDPEAVVNARIPEREFSFTHWRDFIAPRLAGAPSAKLYHF